MREAGSYGESHGENENILALEEPMRDTMRAIARRLGAVAADCTYAQRRVTELHSSLDGYLPDPDNAPGTYQEFLARTSGLLTHEPPARRRSAGPAVR